MLVAERVARDEAALNGNVTMTRRRMANPMRLYGSHGAKMTGNDEWRGWGSERLRRKCTGRSARARARAGKRIGADNVACSGRVFIM